MHVRVLSTFALRICQRLPLATSRMEAHGASMLRVDQGTPGSGNHVLLFSNPHTQERDRTHQTIQVSFNDGLSWPRENYLLLDDGLAEGYSSMTRIDDGHIGIAYGSSQADIAFQIIPLAELLHGPTGAPAASR